MVNSKIEFEKPSDMEMSDFIEIIKKELLTRNIVNYHIYIDGKDISNDSRSSIVKGGDPNTSTFPYKDFEYGMNHFFDNLKYMIDYLFQPTTNTTNKSDSENIQNTFNLFESNTSSSSENNTEKEPAHLTSIIETNPMKLSPTEVKERKSIFKLETNPMDLSKHYTDEPNVSPTKNDPLFEVHPMKVSPIRLEPKLESELKSIETHPPEEIKTEMANNESAISVPSSNIQPSHIVLEIEYKTKCFSMEEYYKEREIREARMNEFADTKREYRILECYIGIDDKEKIEESMKYTKEWYRLSLRK
jgi:hypothetical protein